MFRTLRFIFRKTVLYTIMVWYCVLYRHRYLLTYLLAYFLWAG